MHPLRLALTVILGILGLLLYVASLAAYYKLLEVASEPQAEGGLLASLE